MLCRSQMVGMIIAPHKLALSVDALAHVVLLVGGPLQGHVGVRHFCHQNEFTQEIDVQNETCDS